MFLTLYSFCRFHFFRLLHAQPVLLGLCGIGIVCLMSLSIVLVNSYAERHLAQEQLREALYGIEKLHQERTQNDAALQPSMSLPVFESAKLVSTLNDTAANTGVTLDEVSYVLEENAEQPFLRYRITFAVLSRYPVIKKMMAQLQKETPHIMLDAISCSREDIKVAELNCDLVFSAFFKKI